MCKWSSENKCNDFPDSGTEKKLASCGAKWRSDKEAKKKSSCVRKEGRAVGYEIGMTILLMKRMKWNWQELNSGVQHSLTFRKPWRWQAMTLSWYVDFVDFTVCVSPHWLEIPNQAADKEEMLCSGVRALPKSQMGDKRVVRPPTFRKHLRRCGDVLGTVLIPTKQSRLGGIFGRRKKYLTFRFSST